MTKDLATLLFRYEDDELDYDETLRLFQVLVDTGIAWHLQGHYGRTAYRMLQERLIEPPPDDRRA